MSHEFGKVVQIINKYKIVINRGSVDGVTSSQRFLVYFLGDDIVDPDTHASLGKLELVCGTGAPTHIQERITTIESDKIDIIRETTVRRSNNVFHFGNSKDEEIITPISNRKPFDNVRVGALVKVI